VLLVLVVVDHSVVQLGKLSTALCQDCPLMPTELGPLGVQQRAVLQSWHLKLRFSASTNHEKRRKYGHIELLCAGDQGICLPSFSCSMFIPTRAGVPNL
jgi:hypothetical protein